MLSGSTIQRFIGRHLERLYEDATIEVFNQDDTRDPVTGTFAWISGGSISVKAQRDDCTEAQRAQDGYSATDCRFLVVQRGVMASAPLAQENDDLLLQEDLFWILTEGGSPARPDTDWRLTYRGETFRIMSVSADPARVYWDFRARLTR